MTVAGENPLKSTANSQWSLEIKYSQKPRCVPVCCAPIRPPTLLKYFFSCELLFPPPNFAVCHTNMKQQITTASCNKMSLFSLCSCLYQIRHSSCWRSCLTYPQHKHDIPHLSSHRTALTHQHVWWYKWNALDPESKGKRRTKIWVWGGKNQDLPHGGKATMEKSRWSETIVHGNFS